MATTVEKVIVSGRKRGKGIRIAFLAPPILIYLIFYIYPAFNAIKYALYDWSGFDFGTARFVGLGNFKEAIKDKLMQVALQNNVFILVFGGVVMFSAALFFAAVLTTPGFRGRSFYKSVIFLPYVLNEVGVALLWIFILQPRFGMLNVLLKNIGLGAMAQVWLGDRFLALSCIIFIIAWHGIGFYMILLMSGIETIPLDLYDAAKVDGASSIQTFRYLTLPLLRDILAIAVVYWMIGALKVFGLVWAITGTNGGGTTNGTQTVATYMYMTAFPYQSANFRLGYATAISVVLCILVFAVSLLFFRLQRKEAIEY